MPARRAGCGGSSSRRRSSPATRRGGARRGDRAAGRDAYGRSKQEGERLLRECSIEDVVIRPSHVYGPGGWFAEEFVDRLRKPGRFAVIGSGENWWDVVRAEDVASACALAAERAPDGAALPRRRRRADPLLRLRRARPPRRSAPGRRAASRHGSPVSPPAPTRSAPSSARRRARTPGSRPSSAGSRAGRRGGRGAGRGGGARAAVRDVARTNGISEGRRGCGRVARAPKSN